MNVFSLDLNTDSESLSMTDAGSEFQTDGVAHRKERFAKSVRANGWMSNDSDRARCLFCCAKSSFRHVV